MKIGILQTGIVIPELAEIHGQYPQMFVDKLGPYGFDFETFAVVENQFPQAPDVADGWLVTGSKHGVYEDHAWLPPLEQLIRDIVAAERPLVGICFGHQVIAQALGGKAEKFPGGWAIGPQTYDVVGRGAHTIMAWHQDQVTRPPADSVTLASNPFCAHAALLYPGKAYTVQPHPEFDAPFTHGLAEMRGPGVVPDTQLRAAKAEMDRPLDNAAWINDLAHFLKHKRLPDRAA